VSTTTSTTTSSVTNSAIAIRRVHRHRATRFGIAGEYLRAGDQFRPASSSRSWINAAEPAWARLTDVPVRIEPVESDLLERDPERFRILLHDRHDEAVFGSPPAVKRAVGVVAALDVPASSVGIAGRSFRSLADRESELEEEALGAPA
jgi:hypothetical protein